MSVEGANDALLDCEWADVLRLLKLALRYVGYSGWFGETEYTELVGANVLVVRVAGTSCLYVDDKNPSVVGDTGWYA